MVARALFHCAFANAVARQSISFALFATRRSDRLEWESQSGEKGGERARLTHDDQFIRAASVRLCIQIDYRQSIFVAAAIFQSG